MVSEGLSDTSSSSALMVKNQVTGGRVEILPNLKNISYPWLGRERVMEGSCFGLNAFKCSTGSSDTKVAPHSSCHARPYKGQGSLLRIRKNMGQTINVKVGKQSAFVIVKADVPT